MPAGPTYVPIMTLALNTQTASVTFTNIPQTYTDLVLVMSSRNVTSNNNGQIWFNNDTSALYSNTTLFATGSSAQSSRITNATIMYTPDISSTHNSPTIVNIMNYRNTNFNKTVLIQGGARNTNTALWVGMYRSNNAITSISLASFGGDWTSTSVFNLYGIAAA